MIFVDLLPGVREKLRDYCVQLPALICTEEVGETGKQHVHILAHFPSPESRQTLRNRLFKFFDIKFKKGECALTQWTTYGKDKGLEEYVCKGPQAHAGHSAKKCVCVKSPPIVLYKNWLEDEMVHHEKWWDEHNRVLEDSKGAKVPLFEELILNINGKEELDKTDYMKMFSYVCDQAMVITRGKINDNIAFPHIQRVMYEYFPKVVSGEFQTRMAKKFSHY
jgi:hypothetical protein